MAHYTVLLCVSTVIIYAVLYNSTMLTIVLLAGTLIYIGKEVLYNVQNKWLIALIQVMTFMEFSKLYDRKIMMDVKHRMYDHAQVLLSLAKWADTRTGSEARFYERVISHLGEPISNSAMMDIILTMTYLLAYNKDPTLEEIKMLIGESEFTNDHISAYTLYTEIINECNTLKTVVTVNDTGKDWHIDDAVALFILFDILMLVKPPNLRLYVIGAGRDPEAATHNHKVLATGILGDAIRNVYFLNGPGAANEAATGVQHVVKFVKSGKLPTTCGSEMLLDLQHADIIAFCAETSCAKMVVHIDTVVGGIQGGFEKSSSGAYKGFNAVQSHRATMALEEWRSTKVNNIICATKQYAENLSSHGTDMFNRLLHLVGVFSVDMQLPSLLRIDPIRYDGIGTVIPASLMSDGLYDEMTPLLVQLGILHNPSVWILSIPGMRGKLTNPAALNTSAVFLGKTWKRKLLLFLWIVVLKIVFMI